MQVEICNEIHQNFHFEKNALSCIGGNVLYKDVFWSNATMSRSLSYSCDNVQEVRFQKKHFQVISGHFYGEGELTNGDTGISSILKLEGGGGT